MGRDESLHELSPFSEGGLISIYELGDEGL
jgi:hypothetical protein